MERVMIVGSNNKATGGIPRYIPEQLDHLPDTVRTAVYDIGAPEGSGSFWFLKSLLLALVDAALFPLRSRPDVVHVHSSQQFSFYRASFYVLFARYVWRRPVILHVHGSSFDEFVSTDSRLSRRIQSLVYAAASEIVVLSEYWEEQLAPYTDSEKISIIPNAVDPDDYDPVLDHDQPRLVFLSNLIERKGVNELLTAVEALCEDHPDLRVSIAGKGPLSDSVEAFVTDRDGVEYLGYVSEEEKQRLLSEGSIYVLPAYAEGLPIAILEAMAGGNAIVSTTVGSIPEVITEENGRLAPPGDADELADALDELVADPESVREMGSYNRSLVEERYCWDTVADQLVNRYEAVTAHDV